MFCLHRISLVRASGETLKRRFCDPLEGTRDLCFLAEQVYWHPTLPDPARPFRRAPRPDPPMVCQGFGFDRLEREIASTMLANLQQFPDMLCMTKVYKDKKTSVY